MADLLVIVPPDEADGYRLAGARVWPAEGPAEAQALVRSALADPSAGIVGVADVFFAELDRPTRTAIERHYRPVVVPLPTVRDERAEERRRAELQELIRRAIGVRIVIGSRPPEVT